MNMFWNKKDNKKTLPDLPPIKSPFSKELSLPDEEAGTPEKMSSDAEQEIESAINIQAPPVFPRLPEQKEGPIEEPPKKPQEKINLPPQIVESKKFKTIELEDEKESSPDKNPYLTSVKSSSSPEKKSYIETTTPYSAPFNAENSFSLNSPPEIETDEMPIAKNESQKNKDVFVKIEKFYSAKKSLDAIKEQIDQIDDILKKIKDVKLKEERELSIWEKEIALVKSRIQNVNQTIFEKL